MAKEKEVTAPEVRAVMRIMAALRAAEKKHPGWHHDPVRQAAILVEEAGEVMQATLNMVEEAEAVGQTTLLPRLQKKTLHEVAQTGAMALRYLINYERSQS
jgi:NTP pyrophosphatase (non-canonical NTP hydrolase)